MRKDVLELKKRAMFWLYAGEGAVFIWLLFVPNGDEVVVIEERHRHVKGRKKYRVFQWAKEDLAEILSEYWAGAVRFKGYRLENMGVFEENLPKDWIEKCKKWWETKEVLQNARFKEGKDLLQDSELSKLYHNIYLKGIKEGYYLFYP
ncbi:hypothetical protein [Thermocrinis sp.]|jgi:hypothetical protein|uniref:hypothetical protein n=1 Tax=Thermocrinis sp. TaxID=2024383 RepID=UPI003C0EC32F